MQNLPIANLIPNMAGNLSSLSQAMHGCRNALNSSSVIDSRRLVSRDSVPCARSAKDSKVADEAAHLQFDTHAEWILSFVIDHVGSIFSREGIRVIEYSRFDAQLGAPSESIYFRNASVPE